MIAGWQAPLLTLTTLLVAAPATACPLTRSTYRAIGNPEYTLTFGDPPTGSASVQAIATVQHPQRGSVFTLRLTQSQGYGAYILFDPDQDNANYRTYFFDQNFQSTAPILNRSNPATYLFVSELGVSDYYSDRPRSRELLLGDVMWKLDTCRPANPR